LLILAVALVLGLLIAMDETGRWDLVLRFICQAPYGRNDRYSIRTSDSISFPGFVTGT
jgi:hypothetical protein